jgi:glycosyltransferase involved in cell wall biosynthesis
MRITVITVCYNSAAHIADALRSVDSQTWPNVEHLIIDGASSDDTLRIIQAHPMPWRRVISEPDHGIYDAMNKGIRLSKGDVIGFVNSDDFYSSPEVLATVARVFTDPSVDACYGDLCYVNRDDIASVVRYWRSSEFRPGLFLHGWCPPHPTFYVRRRVFERLHSFDLQYKIAADFELMARFIEVHRIRTRYIPKVLVKMRLGGTTNRSWSNVVIQNREIWRALKAHGLHPSLISFAAGKLMLRGKQFLSRPA